MSILKDIKDKAKSLINMSEPYAVRKTAPYDASKNKITVAGFVLDGVVTSTLNADTLTKQEQGIDYYYTTTVQNIEQRTLSVSVLPTARCLPVLRLLALKQQESKGWFNISVHENNSIVNVYRGSILTLPELAMAQDAADRTIVFAVKSMSSNTAVIDQPTEFEQESYSKYGNSPDKAGDVVTINEDTGITTTAYDEAVSESL